MTTKQKSAAERKAKAGEKDISDQFSFLNMEMPNGKRLGDCTGDYVSKVCGSLARAAQKRLDQPMCPLPLALVRELLAEDAHPRRKPAIRPA
jgi:hypothetical protein